MDRRSYTEKVDFNPDWLFWVRGGAAATWSGTLSSPSQVSKEFDNDHFVDV